MSAKIESRKNSKTRRRSLPKFQLAVGRWDHSEAHQDIPDPTTARLEWFPMVGTIIIWSCFWNWCSETENTTILKNWELFWG